MRKLTLLMASCIMVFGVFGQKKIQKLNLPSPQVQLLNTAPYTYGYEELSQQLIDNAPRTPSGHIRCFTTESEQLRRLTDPSVKSPEEMREYLDQIVRANQDNPSTQKATRTIPIVVHVIHNGDAVGSGENISDAQVLSQIAALNADFSATNPDFSNTPSIYQGVATNMDIEFCMAQTDPNGQPTNGIDRVQLTAADYANQAAVQAIKPGTQWDPTKYFNIWVFRPATSWGILGYAQFPNSGAANTDGLAVAYYAYGTTGSVSAPYNKGRTATHEMGHCLGLYHIWGDDGTACTGSDGIADTPNQADENYGCPNFATNSSCGNSGDMSMNYMDYTDDACMYMFTDGQKAVVDAVLASAPRRASLLTSTVCNAAAITADFTADVTTINVGGTVNFTDQSVSPNTLNSWTWSFPGGSTTSFNGQNPPAITYNAVGQYDVTLTVTDNASGTDTETKTMYINVINAGACDTLLNIADSDTLRIYGDGAGGYACGWNQWSMPSHAEKYSGYSPYTYVTGCYSYLYGVTDGGNGASVDINVWSDVSNTPGTILGTINIPLSDINSVLTGGQGLIEFMFDEAINVGTGPFYIGFDYNGFGTGDALGIVSNSVYDPTPNSAYCIYSGTWYDMSTLFGDPFSLFISPYMSQDIPTATISTNTTTICAGGSVNFDASSSTNTTGYDWIFNGGSPASSTNTTEAVSYASAGTPRAYLIAYGNCGSYALDSVDITVNPSMSVGSASSSPTVCVNTAITNITHTSTGATGIGAATGLPSGVSANYSAGTITISGTPTASGTFNYSIPLTGACGSANATGTITVNPSMSVGSASSSPTVCVNTAITNITHTSTGATGIGAATGLPSGVSANYSAGTITISGTPTASGTFNYNIPLTGTCGSANATGTITVNPAMTVGSASSTPTVCVNTAMTNVTHTTTNATGIGAATGLPSGVSANYSAGTITISGTPTASGTFNYSIPLTGACGSANATGTITVNALTTPTFTSVAAICEGDALSPLPTTSNNGINGSWSPALDNMNTTMYTFTPAGGQCASTTTMTITVNAPSNNPTFTQVAAICEGDALSPLPTTSNNGITGTWSPALDNMNTTMYTFTPDAGQCATTTTMTITVNTPTTPTFTQVAAICQGDALSPLPTTSNNGITGTWSPALDNMNTTVYTFTPTAGQCAATTTMTITVNTPGTTPTFTQVADACEGDVLSPLPTTSNNGVTGSWSPALDNMNTTMYTFTPDAGQCALTTTMTITVNTVDVASIAYDQATFCIEGANQMPTITGATGGSFSSSPAGLDLNSGTGEITAATSSANTYTVSYLTTGTCPVTAQTTVTMEICSGVKENIADQVKIFPSPASSVLTVQTTNLNVDQIRLMNVLGEVVIAKKVVANKTFLNVEPLSMGVYFIQLIDESGKIMLTQKVSVK